MIQFNLLPDIKIQYIRTKAVKRLVVIVASLTAALALTVTTLLFIVVGVIQKNQISSLNNDIKASSNHINNVPNLNKILTVQNQLNNLGPLHDQKPVVSRLFVYLPQITPVEIKISKLGIDYTLQTVSMTGTADSLSTVNKFVDTLKFTTYAIGDSTDTKPAFSNVVLSSFSLNDKEATFKIDLTFDPAIFNSTLQTKLVVPKTITTRSAIDAPGALFQTPAPTKSSTGGQ